MCALVFTHVPVSPALLRSWDTSIVNRSEFTSVMHSENLQTSEHAKLADRSHAV